MSIAKKYTSEIYNEWNYHAPWLPNTRVHLGDICVVQCNKLVVLGNISSELDLDLNITTSSTSNYVYKSEGGTTVTSKASGEIGENDPSLSTTLEINFTKKNSIFFAAQNCRVQYIENAINIEKMIIEKFKKQEWKANHLVVTELVQAQFSTILICEEPGQKYEVHSKSNSSLMTDLSTNFSLGGCNQSSMAFECIGEGKLTPLVSLSGIKKGWFTDPRIVRRGEIRNNRTPKIVFGPLNLTEVNNFDSEPDTVFGL